MIRRRRAMPLFFAFAITPCCYAFAPLHADIFADDATRRRRYCFATLLHERLSLLFRHLLLHAALMPLP